MIKYLILALLLSCTTPDTKSSEPLSTEQIHGRGHEGKRPLIYRAKVPHSWVRRDPLATTNLSDTTLSIVDFFIVDDEGAVRIAIHNFPTERIDQRIPPAAQVARWQRQLENIDPSSVTVEPLSFSGYKGLYFEGASRNDDSPLMVIGWSLQLADIHYRALTPSSNETDTLEHREKRGDVTIKATGPRDVVEKHKEAIQAFAQTFEQIEEIPSR